VRLLLDSHVLVWWLADSPRLNRTIDAHLANPDADIFVSAATTWELAIKISIGRLDVAIDDLMQVFTSGYADKLDVTVAHGFMAAQLPMHHRDPFDRMLVAQARAEGLMLVTSDRALEHYDLPILWN